MFSTTFLDEESRHRKGFFSKVKSYTLRYCAQVFSHVGLTALVVGYSIIGAFVFSHLEGENEIANRVKGGNNRGEILDQLYNITENLRYTLISQELKIEELKRENILLRGSKRKCERNRKREGHFLESVINQCKGDNVPLTDKRCSQFCKTNNVKLPVCKALCETRVPSCSYWHQDSFKAPLESFETVTNRSRRTTDELLDAHWMSRLRAYREIRETDQEEKDLHSNNTDHLDLGESEKQEFKVHKPLKTARCENIACVSHESMNDVACLDLEKINLLPGSLVGNARMKPLNSSENFNVLWKENWTKEAEKVLKSFEKDIIIKVKTEGYDGREASADEDVVDEPSQWSISGSLLFSVTVITTIGYGNIAPNTAAGQIATMVYATFGMPIFMLWVSNMGTILAQTFTFLYANVCCFMCRRGKRKKELKVKKQQEDIERVTLCGSEQVSSKFLWSERDVSPALTTSTYITGMTPYMQRGHSTQGSDHIIQNQYNNTNSNLNLDPKLKEMLNICATYNIDQGDVDDPLSEAVVDELRNADAMERSFNASALTLPQRTPQPMTVTRGHSECSSYENNTNTPERELSARPTACLGVKKPRQSLDWKEKLTHPSVVAINNQDWTTSTSLLFTSPNNLTVPKASRNPSPSSSKTDVPNSEKNEESFTNLSVKTKQSEGEEVPVPIESVPALPVLCFLGLYLTLGAVIFSAWENWSFLEGFYFSFITLTTIGFGDYVPGDSVMNVESSDGQYKLLCSVVYVLLGLAVLSMSLNLIQEEVADLAVKLAKDCGIIDDDDDDDNEDALDGS